MRSPGLAEPGGLANSLSPSLPLGLCPGFLCAALRLASWLPRVPGVSRSEGVCEREEPHPLKLAWPAAELAWPAPTAAASASAAGASASRMLLHVLGACWYRRWYSCACGERDAVYGSCTASMHPNSWLFCKEACTQTRHVPPPPTPTPGPTSKGEIWLGLSTTRALLSLTFGCSSSERRLRPYFSLGALALGASGACGAAGGLVRVPGRLGQPLSSSPAAAAALLACIGPERTVGAH